MHIVDIALKDLLQVIRDRKSLLFLVLMPIAFTLIFGFAFRRSWLDFVVAEENRMRVAQSIGKFYHAAVVLNAILAVILNQALPLE